MIVVEAIRVRCASFMVLTATVSEIFGGQTNSSILVVYNGEGFRTISFRHELDWERKQLHRLFDDRCWVVCHLESHGNLEAFL